MIVPYVGPVIVFVLAMLAFFLLKLNPEADKLIVAPEMHFYIVSAVSLLSIFIGIAVGMAGNRLRNTQITFLSLSFISLAGLFTLHGLSTPGFLLLPSHVPGVSAQLSVLLATFFLWCSSLPSDHAIVRVFSRCKDWLVSAWLGVIAALIAVGLIYPHGVALLPLNQGTLQGVVTLAVIIFTLYAASVYMRSYRYFKFPMQLSIVYSAGLYIAAQVVIVTGETWRLSWWLYHLYLLFGMLVTLWGIVRQYAVKGSLVQGLNALFITDPVERLTNSLSPSVKALILATESKDSYTAGHNFRVALYALRIGEEMGLSPEQLRALAQGTIVHDIGKMRIPDAILNKPGKLTDEERKVIETHPVHGYDLCKNLGFMREELEIIRHHHERWDGRGYPDKLKGEAIPFLARIVAVADVYDALTSNRAYRQAWSHEAALQFLVENSGSHFDPACVQAWLWVCEREPEIWAYANRSMERAGFGIPASVSFGATG